MDKIRNQRTRVIMKVNENILEVIEERKLRWFGLVTRMGEDRIWNGMLKAEGEEERHKKNGWMESGVVVCIDGIDGRR